MTIPEGGPASARGGARVSHSRAARCLASDRPVRPAVVASGRPRTAFWFGFDIPTDVGGLPAAKKEKRRMRRHTSGFGPTRRGVLAHVWGE